MFACPIKLKAASAVLGGSLLLSACSLDPYVEAPVPRPGLVPSEDQAEDLADRPYAFEEGSTNLKTSYVSIESARAYAQFVQDAYQNALARRSTARTAVNLASLGAALSTLGLGVVGAGQDPILITGLTSAALGIGGQLLLTKDHEAAYSLGARAVGCVVTAATNARPASLPLLGVEAARQHLHEITTRYRAALAAADAEVRGSESLRAFLPAHEQRLAEARQRLANAEYNLNYAARFLQSANVLGEQLVNKVEEIRWAVNDAVRRSEPDVLVLDQGLRSILSSRLSGLGVPLPAEAGAAVVDVQGVTPFESGTDRGLFSAWYEADGLSSKLADAVQKLQRALDAAGGEAVRFPPGAFADCSLSEIENITGAGTLTIEPATVEIQPNQPNIVHASVRGAPPFAVFDDGGLSQRPTIIGSQLQVKVSSDEAKSNRRIPIIVGNLFGKSAVFAIRVAGAGGT